MPKDEDENVAFLVVGDPFGATTHSDLVLRAWKKDIEANKRNIRKICLIKRILLTDIKSLYYSMIQVKIIHNSSILTAIGCCGLQLYRFGETVSIPYWNNDWRPNSFYEKIISNRQRDLHTLCLLDIKIKEPTIESITKKKKVYMPSQFMTVSEAATQLLKVIEEKIEETKEKPGKILEKYHFQINLPLTNPWKMKLVVLQCWRNRVS